MEDRREIDRDINRKLDDVLNIVTEIKTNNAVCEQRLGILEQTARSNKEAIKGNGHPGLESRTMLLEKQMASINWIGGALLLAVLGDLVTRILNIVK